MKPRIVTTSKPQQAQLNLNRLYQECDDALSYDIYCKANWFFGTYPAPSREKNPIQWLVGMYLMQQLYVDDHKGLNT
jgi:hypothetical protein